MVMRPEILILDEPTSRLDPIAADELFSALVRVNRELGTTVIMTEHRLDEALSAATGAVVIDDGKILAEGTPADVARKIADGDVGSGTRALRAALPAYMRIGEGSVRAARELVGGLASENRLFTLPEKNERVRGDCSRGLYSLNAVLSRKRRRPRCSRRSRDRSSRKTR